MGRKKITRSKKNKKTSWKVILAFFAFMIIFTGVTAPFMILYGPFEDAKHLLEQQCLQCTISG